jgi:diguanylate cyclase (GGDEF)-like protein/PAS domain S-box-containing protein
MNAGTTIEATLDDTTLEYLLSRSADVTLLIDASTGRSIRRWYDPTTSRLELPESPSERGITWIHPDDLPAVLDTMACAAHEGGTHSTVARIRPDGPGVTERTIKISAHDVGDVVPYGLLVHAWLVELHAPVPDAATVAMSSLAEAAPVGLQVRSANGHTSFENRRFSELAASSSDIIDARIRAGLDCDAELVEDLDVAGRSLRLRVVPTCDEEGRLVLAIASLEDVTSQRVAEARRVAAEGLFRAAFDGSSVATAVVDLDSRLVQVNDALVMICGRPAEELLDHGFAEITHPDDVALDVDLLGEVRAGRRNGYRMEKRLLHRAGHEVWVELAMSAVRDGDGAISHLVCHVEDISGRKALIGMADSSDELAYWATHDHLTGLPNRRYLDSFLTASIGPHRRAADRLTVIFLDLDDFKPVNDVHGHQVGDEVLRVIATRLRNVAREDELVARYGGDEFVVVTTRACTPSDVSLLAERILTGVRTPIGGLADGPIRVGASVGIGQGTGGDDPSEVLRRADSASYCAKRDGKGRIHHHDDDDPAVGT